MATSTRSSYSSRSRKRSFSTALPASVAWLEHVAMEMTATVHKAPCNKKTVEYTLHLRHKDTNKSWTVSHAFDEFKKFQQELLQLLQRGHVCHAECPWLHSFVKSYFPKNHLFTSNSSPRVVEKRRQTLLRLMMALQQSLVNRGNHSCPIVVDDLAEAFSDFVAGNEEYINNYSLEVSLEKHSRVSSCSSVSYTSGEEDVGKFFFEDYHDTTCGLCDGNLDCDDSLPTDTSTSSSSTSMACCSTTTLNCGHHFHDECLLPSLDACMTCPVCHHEAQED